MSAAYQQHPRLFGWVDPAYDAETDVRALRALDEQERLMAACLCGYDGGYGDDGSKGRRFPDPQCPVHREEDGFV